MLSRKYQSEISRRPEEEEQEKEFRVSLSKLFH